MTCELIRTRVEALEWADLLVDEGDITKEELSKIPEPMIAGCLRSIKESRRFPDVLNFDRTKAIAVLKLVAE